jgi:hypothetical protein
MNIFRLGVRISQIPAVLAGKYNTSPAVTSIGVPPSGVNEHSPSKKWQNSALTTCRRQHPGEHSHNPTDAFAFDGGDKDRELTRATGSPRGIATAFLGGNLI